MENLKFHFLKSIVDGIETVNCMGIYNETPISTCYAKIDYAVPYENNNVYWVGLARFYVSPPYRNCGVGKMMLEELEGYIKKNYLLYFDSYIALAVRKDNERGKKFWTARGFEQDREDSDNLFMRRKIVI